MVSELQFHKHFNIIHKLMVSDTIYSETLMISDITCCTPIVMGFATWDITFHSVIESKAESNLPSASNVNQKLYHG